MAGRLRAVSPGSLIALVAVALLVGGGGAYAGVQLGKNSVHSRNIAPGAVRSSDIRNGAVRAGDLGANSVGSRSNANLKFDVVRRLTPVGFVDTAKNVTLLRRGPFRIYGRCGFNNPPTAVTFQGYISSSRAGAVAYVGTSPKLTGSGNYLGPDTPEASRYFFAAFEGTSGQTDHNFGSVSAIHGGTALNAVVTAYVKNERTSQVAKGDGTYGQGNRCLVHAYELGVG